MQGQTQNLHGHQTERQKEIYRCSHKITISHERTVCSNRGLFYKWSRYSFLPSIGSKSETPLSLRHAGEWIAVSQGTQCWTEPALVSLALTEHVCEYVCLSALPAVWLPLPQPQLACPASAFLTRLLYTQERHGKRTGEGRECAGVRVADRASLPGNRDGSSGFTNAHHLPCVWTYQRTQQQVFLFYLKRTLWHKSN